jgi:hypothetical protein
VENQIIVDNQYVIELAIMGVLVRRADIDTRLCGMDGFHIEALLADTNAISTLHAGMFAARTDFTQKGSIRMILVDFYHRRVGLSNIHQTYTKNCPK